MNAREFTAFCKDTGLMDTKLTSKTVKQIFAKCQQLSEDDDDDDNELVFPEFQEAVCNLAMHRIPNPYTPFAKVTRGERAFPWQRRLRHRITRSGSCAEARNVPDRNDIPYSAIIDHPPNARAAAGTAESPSGSWQEGYPK